MIMRNIKGEVTRERMYVYVTYIIRFCHSVLTGLKRIQQWTKESMRTKPFSLAVGKDWSKTDLREIHTNLTY